MSATRVRTLNNGPYEVKGPIELVDGSGKSFTLTDEAIYLCRCGQSQNKPFCDGGHKGCSFQASEAAR